MSETNEQQVKPEFTLAKALGHVIANSRTGDVDAGRNEAALEVAEPAIRALPELIEAAEAVVQECKQGPYIVVTKQDEAGKLRAWRRLIAALAKARGEEVGG